MAVTKINDGGPAFPRQPTMMGTCPVEGATGMSLRDYFAGQAIASVYPGMIAQSEGNTTEESIAAVAYRMADAMLRARLS